MMLAERLGRRYVARRRPAAAAHAHPGSIAVAGSLLLHALAGTALWFSGFAPRPAMPEFRVYRVNIVSPPPQQAGEPEVVPPAPAAELPRVVKPQQPPPPVPAPPQPARKAPAKVQLPAAAQPRKESAPTKGRNPDASSPGGTGLNVQLSGEQFPYPEYLENIIQQLHRYFRWTGRSGPEAVVYFVILRDGSVEDIRLVRGSGDVAFNFEAMGAVEQAGRRKAFGRLPEGFEGDRLPISFCFQPPGSPPCEK
ncbi:MAG: TonB C-terminal domain-containing protein [Gemmatimonadetes bacterium]|nr:TonB C-terminal domain-containing protein [Gemmatimonadota bacterium]